MKMLENYSLKEFNTFGVDVKAAHLLLVDQESDLTALATECPWGEAPLLILGGGSNLLFVSDFPGWVIQVNTRGRELVDQDDEYYFVKAAAGENWIEFVDYCTDSGYAGLENLALIPGKVGSSPIQNIGAYGVELKDVFYQLEAIEMGTGKRQVFRYADCAFGYRMSAFKQALKGQYIILNVTFRLRKKPVLKLNYGAIQSELQRVGVQEVSIQAVREAVVSIRRSKLPETSELGNAGSFFKNPVIPEKQYSELQSQFPELVSYPAKDGYRKLAAGWMIEQCGWKGKRIGDAGVHEKQALVLVNYGQATGREIFDLSEAILQSVFNKFGVMLEREVNVVDGL